MSRGALLLDSAPSDSSDDSGPVLAKPPSRLGGTAVGNFGGIRCCTFHSGLRSSSEHRPGYSLLPHLYQDFTKIAFPNASGQFRVEVGGSGGQSFFLDIPICRTLPAPFISIERYPKQSCSSAAWT
jgi:hypothetical protein